MLKDITFGQHFPGTSPVHRLDPRFKILLTLAFLVVLYIGTNPAGILLSIAFVAFAYLLAHIPAKLLWRSLKPILPLLLFSAALNLFFYTGTPLFSWWFITITREGVYYGIFNALRVICLLAGTSLLTYTTSPIALTDAIERLLSPLKIFRFPAHELAMMMTIALRFIPTLIEETDKIMSAQKARGAELDSGTLAQRVRALVPILIPLFLSAFRRGDELAIAMECRCYNGGEGRTRLRQLKITAGDVVSTLVCGGIFALIAFSGSLFPGLQIFL